MASLQENLMKADWSLRSIFLITLGIVLIIYSFFSWFNEGNQLEFALLGLVSIGIGYWMTRGKK